MEGHDLYKDTSGIQPQEKGLVMSFDEMRHQIRRVEARKIIKKPTQNRYVIPSATDKSQLEIYDALD